MAPDLFTFRLLIIEPNSESCLDLIFAVLPCDKVIIVPDTNYITSESENSCWICEVLVASKIQAFKWVQSM